MSAILNFAILGVLIVVAAWIVQRAKRFTDGDDGRERLESLTALCGLDGLTPDERRAISAEVESRL